MAASTPGAADPSPDVYPALAEELAGLASTAARLQAVTGALAAAADPEVASAHRFELQALDLLTQRLHALVAFFDAMPDVERAIGAVPLADLARRLRGEAQGVASQADELELF